MYRYDTIALGLLNKEKCQIIIFLLCMVHTVRKLRYYSDVIYSFHWKSAIKHDGGV